MNMMLKNKQVNNKENKRKILQEVISKDVAIQNLKDASKSDVKPLLKKLHSSWEGMKENDISVNRETYGENIIAREKKKSLAKRLVEAFVNTFTVILFCLAMVSIVTDIIIPYVNRTPEEVNYLTVIIIMTMVIVSGTLRYIEETRSGNAAARLLEMITTTCCVERKETGKEELPLNQVVVGDIIYLSAGDMLPADVRIIEAKDLFVSQSALTGESELIEKIYTTMEGETGSITECSNLAFMGSNVISGSAKAVVISVGDSTLFGSMAKSIAGEAVETSFTKGVNSVSWVLVKFMLIMVPIVFFINGITKGDWVEAFLFAISIAVGLTPEMLPMIVTTCLAKGAVAMSKKKTIIKNLNSIQNFGAMDVLCTDKTGTLTQDRVVLEYYMNCEGKESSRVLRHAYLNSFFQTGYKNLMDRAIIEKTEEQESRDKTLTDLSEVYKKVDEIPFDFARRRLSVVVEDENGKTQMITKGAVEEMLSICSYAEYDGEIAPLTEKIKNKILRVVNNLNEDGMRVIALAQKTNPSPIGTFGVKDECEMVLLGYLAFLDPPKDSTKDAIRVLMEHGVRTKILTGDNEKVTRCICQQVGLSVDKILLGADIDKMTEEELKREVEVTTVFAKLSPDQKAMIVTMLRENGHTVGFMGDGINDAAAMKASDVGISVDSAVDIAKESADIILLEKSLMVLEEGIIEGRKTYANMIKYIKMTASSNFGNMFSVLAASALLPFLPMMSVHLILLNLIYDISCMAIPWDNVDEEFLKEPRSWDASSIGSFMLWIGPTSSVFDWTTYLLMYFVICPMFVSNGVLFNAIQSGSIIQSGIFAGLDMRTTYIAMFQAGWFVESMWTQTLVIHMIRTQKIPFIQSRASLPLTLLTGAGIGVLTIIPFTELGKILGFVKLPPIYFVFLAITVILYMILVTILKKMYVKRYGSLM